MPEKWGFSLPVASAILTVLYPDEFTELALTNKNTRSGFLKQLNGLKDSTSRE